MKDDEKLGEWEGIVFIIAILLSMVVLVATVSEFYNQSPDNPKNMISMLNSMEITDYDYARVDNIFYEKNGTEWQKYSENTPLISTGITAEVIYRSPEMKTPYPFEVEFFKKVTGD